MSSQYGIGAHCIFIERNKKRIILQPSCAPPRRNPQANKNSLDYTRTDRL